MNEYEKISQKQAKIEKENLKEKQGSCEHKHLDTIYKVRCVECHKELLFRTPEDIKRRGEIGRGHDYD